MNLSHNKHLCDVCDFNQEIKDREYVAKVKKRGYENILSFGVVFDGKRVWVKEV
ncbi:Conserved protein, with a weak D-galactarate dehydratase/altronate hydrolase domain [hydrothermal vent metagenome]|uniref:Conserved protein, with a weak D-galactarate dehydratase/altronate hydrolase domain n=1 Tax=hydrothermal vent metagenome TaxID=652676 RepID=A0A1W1CJM4_9ZZZZ